METPTEGPLIFTCPACAARYPLNWQLAGKTIHCKSCSQIVIADPEQLTIPTHAPVDALQQLRDALAEASGMTAAAHDLLVQYNRKQASEEKSRQEGWQALLATRDEEVDALKKRIQEMEALVQEGLRKQEAEAKDYQSQLDASEKRIFELAGALKGTEEKLLSMAQKETSLKTLCDSIENNLKKDIDSHQLLLASLRQQLKFG